jgi:5'-3' exonuclease
MIIMDYNGIAIGNIMINKENDEDMIRHMILNTIRMYKVKFQKEYGDVVIACDGMNNWRKEVFPQYKANRRKSRETSDFDWNEAFRILHSVREELLENFPYKVIHVDGCEADDIIGTLVENTNEFGNHEKVMIVSADKDFAQLQRYGNVRQFSPLTKKFIDEDHARLKLQEHIIRGDASDGVPNVLSHDDVFIEGLRQTPVTKKKLTEILDNLGDGHQPHGASWYRNYQRNQRLIDLTFTPQELKSEILNEYKFQDPWKNRGKVLPYLINKKCKLLIESIEELI